MPGCAWHCTAASPRPRQSAPAFLTERSLPLPQPPLFAQGISAPEESSAGCLLFQGTIAAILPAN